MRGGIPVPGKGGERVEWGMGPAQTASTESYSPCHARKPDPELFRSVPAISPIVDPGTLLGVRGLGVSGDLQQLPWPHRIQWQPSQHCCIVRYWET